MAVLDDEIKKCLAADLLRHGESVGLVDPHQRGMDGDAFVETKRQRNLHSFDRIVAAVRIAGIIRFAHAGDQMSGTAPISQRSRKAEENQIAAGHEGRRQAAVSAIAIAVSRVSAVSEMAASASSLIR